MKTAAPLRVTTAWETRFIDQLQGCWTRRNSQTSRPSGALTTKLNAYTKPHWEPKQPQQAATSMLNTTHAKSHNSMCAMCKNTTEVHKTSGKIQSLTYHWKSSGQRAGVESSHDNILPVISDLAGNVSLKGQLDPRLCDWLVLHSVKHTLLMFSEEVFLHKFKKRSS